MEFNNITEITNFINNNGIDANKIKSIMAQTSQNSFVFYEEWPICEQINLKDTYYPHNYFSKNGSYDGKSTMYTVLGIDNHITDYSNKSIFMVSYRENIIKIFSVIESIMNNSNKLQIVFPAGGNPSYYCPSLKNTQHQFAKITKLYILLGKQRRYHKNER